MKLKTKRRVKPNDTKDTLQYINIIPKLINSKEHHHVCRQRITSITEHITRNV